MKISFLSVALYLCWYSALAYEHPDSLSSKLSELDQVLAQRQEYESIRHERVSVLEAKYCTEGISLEQKYYLGKSLIEECLSCDFEKAHFYLKDNLQTAEALHDDGKTEESLIKLAYFYASSGFYYEANEILNARLPEPPQDDANYQLYCLAQQNLYNELLNHSELPYMEESVAQKAGYYTDRLLEILPHDSSDWLRLKVIDLLSKHALEEADRMCSTALNVFCTKPRQYALAAYLKAIICSARGNQESMAYWYAVSACEYSKLCVKDNNSLFILSSWLYEKGDMERSIQYAAIALSNSSSYDRNLRYRNIAGFLNTLENGARDAGEARLKQARTTLWVVAGFSICLFLVLAVLMLANRVLVRTKNSLKESNQKILELNRALSAKASEISEANRVKEEYIGLFLINNAEYIDKLRSFQNDVRRRISRNQTAELLTELKDVDRVEQELDNFYRSFDDIFLNIYPTFVEDFNALLSEGAKIIPPKGSLNSELRIFALIRLGINDSTKIASLMHYSVQTIYNYRNRTKNRALNRETFEDDVKRIGSFSV